MPTSDEHPADPKQISPELGACLRIIEDYLEGLVPLKDAAPLLQTALRANPNGINLEISPSLRLLFAEVARLEGSPAPDLGPDPNRHVRRRQTRPDDLAERAWRAMSTLSNEPHSISCHFEAAREETARDITSWLKAHGFEEIVVESPAEADADDWVIRANTRSMRWTKDVVSNWAQTISSTPLGGQASFMGYSVW